MKTSYTFPVDSILLLGPTGVGKSPLGEAIAKNGLFHRTCYHFDFGAELRNAVSDAQRTVSYLKEEQDFMHGVLEQGLLLENEHFPLAQKILMLFLDRTGFSQHDLLVLNGMPRHAGQAQDVSTLAHMNALIVLDCSADEVFFRIRDNVGGDRTERVDDNKGLIGKKLMIFRERTAPLVEHYKMLGCRIYRLGVSATMTPSDAYKAISDLAAGDPPVSLVTKPPVR